MSNKPRFGIIFILVCMATSITFAQTYFSKVTQNSNPPPLATPRSPAMSADEFKSVSQQQGQQTQQALTSQVNKAVSSAPFPMPQMNGAAPQQQTQQQQQIAQPQTTTTTTQTTTQTNSDNSGQTDSGNDQQQQTQQPYTGYQAAPSSSGSGSSSSKPQGLGIKY